MMPTCDNDRRPAGGTSKTCLTSTGVSPSVAAGSTVAPGREATGESVPDGDGRVCGAVGEMAGVSVAGFGGLATGGGGDAGSPKPGGKSDSGLSCPVAGKASVNAVPVTNMIAAMESLRFNCLTRLRCIKRKRHWLLN